MTIFKESIGKTPEQFAKEYIEKHKDSALPSFQMVHMYMEARGKVDMSYWDRVLLYIEQHPYKVPILND